MRIPNIKDKINLSPIWVKLPTSDKLATLGVLLALVFGTGGFYLGKEQIKLGKLQFDLSIDQNKTSLDIAHFGKLLDKTDTVITNSLAQLLVSDSLLKIYKQNQNSIDSANKYRFIAAIFNLGSQIGTREYIIGVQQHKIIGHPFQYINLIIPIMEGQMNNPYLYKDNVMLKLWVNALVHLNMVNPNATFIEDENGKYLMDNNGNGMMDDTNLDEPLDLISDIKINKNLVCAYDATFKAYRYCCKKLKPECSHFISK